MASPQSCVKSREPEHHYMIIHLHISLDLLYTRLYVMLHRRDNKMKTLSAAGRELRENTAGLRSVGYHITASLVTYIVSAASQLFGIFTFHSSNEVCKISVKRRINSFAKNRIFMRKNRQYKLYLLQLIIN